MSTETYIEGDQRLQSNGPFYTGFLINTVKMVAKGYELVQKQVKTHLENQAEGNLAIGWYIEGKQERDLLWEPSDYAGKTVISQSFLIKQLIFDKSSRPSLDCEGGHKFTVVEAFLYFHDYGTGVISLNGIFSINGRITLSAYRKSVEKMSTELGAIVNPHIRESTTALETALDAQNVAITPLHSYQEKFAGQIADLIPFLKGLWYHMIYIFAINDEITKTSVYPYRQFVGTSELGGKVENISLDSTVFAAPGSGRSMIINSPKSAGTINLGRIVELGQYYYAAITLLDHLHFVNISEFSASKEKGLTIKTLEKQIVQLREIKEQLDYFLLLMNNMRTTFSPQSTMFWRVLDKEWFLTTILDTLKQKDNHLEEEYDDHLQFLSQKRQATLNRLVKIFTVFSIVGPLFEVYNFLSGEQGIFLLQLPLEVYILVGALISFAGGALGLILWRMLR